MSRALPRAVARALLGAAVVTAIVTFSYQFHASVALDFERDTPAVVSGLYPSERAGDEAYAWSQRSASLHLPGLDRRVAWSCVVRAKGARQDPATLPDLTLTVDGIVAGRHTTGNDYRPYEVEVPPAAGPGAVVGFSVTNTFRPVDDARDLGVMVERWSCAPVGGARPLPPPAVLWNAAAAGAAMAAAFTALGATWPALLAGLLLFGAGSAVPLTFGVGEFSPGLGRGLVLTLTASALLALTGWWSRRSGRAWSASARLAVAWTLCAALLKLLVLLHPDKPMVDAVFHAHRVLWVLDGRYFFTQTMPSGVQFPYAIGLYVFAAPWTLLTTDLVTLLRVIIVTMEATGGLVLYGMAASVWKRRDVGLSAAALFPLVPLPFVITGNANMTNVFAQAVALAAVGAAAIWPLQWRRPGPAVCFTLLTAAALLSHISTLTLLGAVLAALAVGLWWRGDAALRQSAAVVVTGAAAALVIATGVYYIRFVDAFRSALVMRQSPQGAGAAPVGWLDRVTEAGQLLWSDVGWGLWGLTALGAMAFWRRRWRDRVDLAVLAWLAVAAATVAMVVATPVDRPFQRYAAEFVSRVTFSTAPALVLVGALGLATSWQRGGAARVVATLLATGAAMTAVQQWLQWLR